MKNLPTLDRPPADRANAVGLVRFALTSLVILSHSFHLLGRSAQEDPLVRLSHGQYTLGGLAVDAFFVLSGFLVARSWDGSRGWADFLARRAARIYPGFLVAAAFASLAAAPWLASRGMPRPDVPSWGGLILPALTLDYAEPRVNGSLWTLRYDLAYYLGIALLGTTGMLARRWPLLALWAASWAAYSSRFVIGGHALGVDGIHPRLLTCFLAGATLCAFRDRVRLSWWAFAASVAGLGWLAVAPRQAYMGLAFPILGAYATLFLCFRPGAGAARLAWLGDYTYGLFLYAYPVQLALILLLGPGPGPLGIFLAAWPTAGAFAFLSWRLVERPAMRLVRRRRPSARPRPVPVPHFARREEVRAAAG